MILEPAPDKDIGKIMYILAEARKRPRSDNFLDGFPWGTVRWHRVKSLEAAELEEAFLFCEWMAWGDPARLSPRTVKQGTEEFRNRAFDLTGPSLDHFLDILRQHDLYRTGQKPTRRFLILVDQGHGTPFMILDGNHRAVAALWWRDEGQADTHLPRKAWLGRLPATPIYPPYDRILKQRK